MQSPGNVLLESYILRWVGLYIQTWLKTIGNVQPSFSRAFSNWSCEPLNRVLVTCASHDTSDFGQLPSFSFTTSLLIRNREPEKIVTTIGLQENTLLRSTNTISVSSLKQKKPHFKLFSLLLRVLEFFLTYS